MEAVYVHKVLSNDDRAIIVRENGDAYLIKKEADVFRYGGTRGRQF